MIIGTWLFTKMRGELVGTDAEGNRYFQDKRIVPGTRRKRWVMYNGVAEASRIPPEWHGWLHYMLAEPPPAGGLPALDDDLVDLGLQVDAATEAVRQLPAAEQQRLLFAVKDHAWRTIFWTCLLPGLVFTGGVLLISESPRWLVRRGRIETARHALQRTVAASDVEPTLQRMQAPEELQIGRNGKRDPLLSRRYVVPFLLACVVLACTQATGINSVLAYAVNILNQAGGRIAGHMLLDRGAVVVTNHGVIVGQVLMEEGAEASDDEMADQEEN